MKITAPQQLREVVRENSITVLSVDLFDTLVYRRCSRPDRVFALQFFDIRQLVPTVESVEAWVQLRKSAEMLVSADSFPEEIHLNQIYAYIRSHLCLSSDDTHRLVEAELAAESLVITSFPEVVQVLRDLHEAGTRIVINTDIYLPAAFIRNLVERVCGFEVDLLCSSETLRPKRTGAAFPLLKDSYPNEHVFHVGDNPYSDYKMARRHGVDACVIEWDRNRWLNANSEWCTYLDDLGCLQIPDPPCHSTASPGDLACDTLAWRWAAVLFDFLVCLKNYATTIAADEIWFLSRDCESLYSSFSGNSRFLEPFLTKYVYTSRAATYPLFAETQPQRFQALTGRNPDCDDLSKCSTLKAAYRQYLTSGTRRIVIVDAGWKGRVQLALQSALPDVEVYGFYFSLDHLAEPEARAASQCFVPWKPAHMNQAAVECLFGFRGRSCVGYSRNASGGWTPAFHDRYDDVAPEVYCNSLRHYLSTLLSCSGASGAEASMEQRLKAVQRVCMYPDRTTALAFHDWSIGAAIDGADTANLIRGGSAGWILRLLGIQRDGNLWPSAALWGISNHPLVIRVLQSIVFLRKALTFGLKAIMAARAKHTAPSKNTIPSPPLVQTRKLPMRILLLASVFPPKIIGGAELSAYALAKWLKARGHEIGVLTTTQLKSEEIHGETVDGLRMWKVKLAREHTQHEHRAKPQLSKLLWHLQDHFDPRNRSVLAKVVEQFQPDIVNVHVMQGLGHNALSFFAGRNIPVFYFLHDLTLACFRTSMYRAGRNCSGQCAPCILSSACKLQAIRRIPNFQLVSPSRSNLDILHRVLRLDGIPGTVLPNLDQAPGNCHQPRDAASPPRLIYLGRLDKTKGIDWLLPILDALIARGHEFELKLVGGGPLERQLRSAYKDRPWITFTGQIPSDDVARHLAHSDLLLLPSLWRENHPGVVRQALRSGVPAMVSDIGGSKEMIVDGQSGVVVPTGDISAWTSALTDLLQNPERLKQLQQGARIQGDSYSAEALGITFEQMFEVSLAKSHSVQPVYRTSASDASLSAS
jgi:glycosyltransferase involved in cell wall biosynthesis/FMN phosphatase YigB (HAD superfamily)